MSKNYEDWMEKIQQEMGDSQTGLGGNGIYNQVINFQFMAITGLYLIATTAGITGQSSWDTLRNEGGNTLTGPVLAANLVLRSVLSLVLAGPIIGLGITTALTLGIGFAGGGIAAMFKSNTEKPNIRLENQGLKTTELAPQPQQQQQQQTQGPPLSKANLGQKMEGVMKRFSSKQYRRVHPESPGVDPQPKKPRKKQSAPHTKKTW